MVLDIEARHAMMCSSHSITESISWCIPLYHNHPSLSQPSIKSSLLQQQILISVRYCSSPVHAVENGRLTDRTKLARYECGVSVAFECEEGHALHGPAELICEEKGWNLKFPLCIETKCPPLDVVANAETKFTHNGKFNESMLSFLLHQSVFVSHQILKICRNFSFWKIYAWNLKGYIFWAVTFFQHASRKRLVKMVFQFNAKCCGQKYCKIIWRYGHWTDMRLT
jgi:hypothetical protein